LIFFDEHGCWLDLTHPEFCKSTKCPILPSCYEDLFLMARTLSESLPFVRCDFYVVKNEIYFGEMTFYPTSGFASYQPFAWEEKMGNWLVLPEKRSL
jgi:hypothetical protein